MNISSYEKNNPGQHNGKEEQKQRIFRSVFGWTVT